LLPLLEPCEAIEEVPIEWSSVETEIGRVGDGEDGGITILLLTFFLDWVFHISEQHLFLGGKRLLYDGGCRSLDFWQTM
jgi:hypothetical protein